MNGAVLHEVQGDCAAHALENWPADCDTSHSGAHDLLLLYPQAGFAGAPAWLDDALVRAPLAVVRRARSPAGYVPVGVRGSTRAQRFGGVVAVAQVRAVIRPEQLLAMAPVPARVSALQLLDLLRPLLAGLVWGPTGSVGFELASGVPTATDASDLDLLIRMPQALSCADARAMLDALDHAAARTNCRVDVQLETPAGAVALAELAQGGRMLLKTIDGPRLVADPWDEPVPALPDWKHR